MDQTPPDPLAWAQPAAPSRPWIRWWWMGSCLTTAEITRELELYARWGFGGLEVQPIDAPEEPPLEPVSYLSPEWNRLLAHALDEAGRLRLGVDLTMGSGWPWGGPQTAAGHAARRLTMEQRSARGGAEDTDVQNGGSVCALVLSPAGGPAAPATVLAPDAAERSALPSGEWVLTIARELTTGQAVKRAGPGGEGPVIDHFSPEAVRSFLSTFDGLLRDLGARSLAHGGLQFDYASDRMVRGLCVQAGRLTTGGAGYSALLFADCEHAELETLEAAAALARAGGTVWFFGGIPRPVPGSADPREPGAVVSAALEQCVRDGTVRVLPLAADPLAEMDRASIRREHLPGFRFIRRASDGSTAYFIKRIAAGPFSGSLCFGAPGTRARVGDPVTGEVSAAEAERLDGGVSVELEVEEGGTRIVAISGEAALPERAPRGVRSRRAATLPPQEIRGPWRLAWRDAEGEPREMKLEALASWPDLPELGLYSGIVTYETRFSLESTAAGHWILDLGELHESAEASLNGKPLRVAWTRPYLLRMPQGALGRTNVLTLRVADLPANRIIAMDRAGIRWRRFHFVSATGGTFDASGWEPLPSGLLGPVLLRPAAQPRRDRSASGGRKGK